LHNTAHNIIELFQSGFMWMTRSCTCLYNQYRLNTSLEYIKRWMANNFLQLNGDKTEVVIFELPRQDALLCKI